MKPSAAVVVTSWIQCGREITPAEIALIVQLRKTYSILSYTEFVGTVVRGAGMVGGVWRAEDRGLHQIFGETSVEENRNLITVSKEQLPALSRHVATKFLHAPDPDQAQRLLREARSQARLDHPGICKVYEVGEVDGRTYIAMQLIDGRSLDVVAPELTIEQCVVILRAVAIAVQAANSLGLIHRDIKPSNIMVTEDSDASLRPFVVDFGIARTAARAVEATPDSTNALNALGLVLMERGSYESNMGVDPRDWIEPAIDAIEKAHGVQPDTIAFDVNLAIAVSVLLEYQELNRVDDPDQTAKPGLAALDRCDKINPEFFWSLTTRGSMRIISVILEHKIVTNTLNHLAKKGIKPGRAPPEQKAHSISEPF